MGITSKIGWRKIQLPLWNKPWSRWNGYLWYGWFAWMSLYLIWNVIQVETNDWITLPQSILQNEAFSYLARGWLNLSSLVVRSFGDVYGSNSLQAKAKFEFEKYDRQWCGSQFILQWKDLPEAGSQLPHDLQWLTWKLAYDSFIPRCRLIWNCLQDQLRVSCIKKLLRYDQLSEPKRCNHHSSWKQQGCYGHALLVWT